MITCNERMSGKNKPVVTTNAKCRTYAECKIPFRGSNLHAEWIGNYYVIYSYKWWPLFVYHYTTNRWYENEDRYSVTTSKQRGQCNPMCHTSQLAILASKDALVEMIRLGDE